MEGGYLILLKKYPCAIHILINEIKLTFINFSSQVKITSNFLGLLIQLTFINLIVNLLFAGENNIEFLGRVLKALRAVLDAPVAVQHVQQAVLRVQHLVLVEQVLGYYLLININLINYFNNN